MLVTDFLPEGLGLQQWFQQNKSWSVGASQKTVVCKWGGMRLLKYPEPKRRSTKTPLLIIPSLINRHYVLDLLPGKSLIEFLTNSDGRG